MKDESISQPRIDLLHPAIREEVKNLIEQAEGVVDETLAIRVVQGLRTIEEQDALYAQGRTIPGSIVTKAKGGSSYHNYGLAIDICWLYKDDNGDYKYDDVKSWKQGGNFRKVIEIFKAAGYTWGGDFKSIPDGPHFEKTFGHNWRDLLDKYNNNDFITGTKYVNL